MAEELVFEINTDSIAKSLADLAASTERLKQANKELAKEAAAGNKEAAVAIERNNAVIKVQNEEYRGLQRTLVGYTATKKGEIDTVNFSNNSIAQNRALLKQLNAEYINLKNPSAEATATIKRLTDALKEQESATGNDTRSVGSYREEIKKALGDLNLFGTNISQVSERAKIGFKIISEAGKDLSNGIKDTASNVRAYAAAQINAAKATSTANEAVRQAEKIGFKYAEGQATITEVEQAQAIASAAAAAKTEALAAAQTAGAAATASATTAMNTFKAALAATGIGAIVISVGALVALFKEFKPIVDGIEQTLGGISTIFTTGFKDGVQTVKLLQDLEDKRRFNLVKSAEIQKQVNELEAQAANKTLPFQKRVELLEKANKLREQGLQIELDAAKQEQQIAEKQAKQSEQSNIAKAAALGPINVLLGKQTLEIEASDEAQQKLAETTANVIKLDDAYSQQVIANQNKIALFKRENAEQEQKEAEDRKKRQNDELRKTQEINQGVIDAANELIAEQESYDEFQRRREEKRLAAITEEFNATVAHYKALETIEINAIDASTDNEETKQKKRLEVQLKYLELNLNATRAFYTADGEFTQAEIDNLKVLESLIEKLRAQLKGVTTKKEKDPTLAEALGLTPEDLGNISQGIGLVEQAVSKISDAFNNEFNLRLQGIEAAKNAELAAIDELDVSEKEKDRRRRNAERQAARAEWEIQVQQFKTNQAVAIVQTIINTAQAIVAQLANPTPYVGIALAAVAAATGAAQIGVISSQQPPPPPKFATGVIGLNGPGTETSDSIPAYLSKGESVMTAKATKQFAPMLAQMEMAVGNKPNWDFSSGHFANGVIGTYGDGGSFVRSITQPQPLTAADLTKAISSMPAPVVSVKQIDKVRGAERSVATSATL